MLKVALIISVFALSLTASASTEWFFYKHFPWVYDNVTKDWLYLRGTDDGKFYAYRASTTTWEDFTVPEVENLPSTLQLQLHESVTMDFILVQPGTFYMGEKDIAEPVHQVKLTKPFYLGKYEVTQSQEGAVYSYPNYVLNPTNQKNNHPTKGRDYDFVEGIIQKLNEQQMNNVPEGWEFVIPSEAQWEFACRAGTTTSFYTGDSITKSDGNWDAGVGINTVNVGSYPPNNWGFYDMHGNVQEWTRTWYNNYTSTFKTDPEPAIINNFEYKITRGGSWKSHGAWLVRSAYRIQQPTHAQDSNLGYRIAIQEK